MKLYKCNICGHDRNNISFVANDLYYNTKNAYEYFECNSCGCVQICKVPKDLSEFYGHAYYTFSGFSTSINVGSVDAVLSSDQFSFLKNCRIENFNFTFLDVGCGNGKFVKDLALSGFKKCVGIDPYINPKHEYESSNCIIKKCSILDLNNKEKYDIIIFNNSLEHVDEHKQILSKAYNLLKDDGICIIIIPIATFSWYLYRTNWYALQAPMHLYIHTYESLNELISKSGFSVYNYFTSYSTRQFVYSELHRLGISWTKITPKVINKNISDKEMKKYEYFANILEKNDLGSMVYLYLSKNDDKRDIKLPIDKKSEIKKMAKIWNDWKDDAIT